MEVIRRGTEGLDDNGKLLPGKTLRWTQTMAAMAMRHGPINMDAGEGKTLAFLADAIMHAAAGESLQVFTTRDTLANQAFTLYERVLGPYGFHVGRMDPDGPGYLPVEDGKPTIYIGTLNDAGFGHLRGKVVPGRMAVIDEIDEALVHADTTWIISDGAAQPAPRDIADSVVRAKDFLDRHLASGALTPDHFGRKDNQVGGPAKLTEDGVAEVTKLLRADGRPADSLESELQRINSAATARWEFVEKDHYIIDRTNGKVYIIDQTTHKVMFDPQTSTESRWNGGLAQAVEAKHGLAIRADSATSSSITAKEMVSSTNLDAVTGASGTAKGVAGELTARFGMPDVVTVPRFEESKLTTLDAAVALDQAAKHQMIADDIARTHGPQTPPQLVITNRNSEVEQVSALLTAANVKHIAIDAKWFLDNGVHAEARLQKILDEAGQLGKVLVINRQGGRGVDIPVSKDVSDAGGLHVKVSGRSHLRDIDIQAENRAARAGQEGSVQYYLAADDALFVQSSEHAVTVIRYTEAVTAHESAQVKYMDAETVHALAERHPGDRTTLDAARDDLDVARSARDAAQTEYRAAKAELLELASTLQARNAAHLASQTVPGLSAALAGIEQSTPSRAFAPTNEKPPPLGTESVTESLRPVDDEVTGDELAHLFREQPFTDSLDSLTGAELTALFDDAVESAGRAPDGSADSPPVGVAPTMPVAMAPYPNASALVSDINGHLVPLDATASLRVLPSDEHGGVRVQLPDNSEFVFSDDMGALAFRQEVQPDGSVLLRPNGTGLFVTDMAGNTRNLLPAGSATGPVPVRPDPVNAAMMNIYAGPAGWLSIDPARLATKVRRATGPLYGGVDEMPAPRDVRQGGAATCYLLSNLIGLAARNPGLIKDMITTSEVDGKRLFTVRFFDPEQQSWASVTVDDTFYTDAAGAMKYAVHDPTQPLWPAVIEKAFAVFRGGHEGYRGIDLGRSGRTGAMVRPPEMPGSGGRSQPTRSVDESMFAHPFELDRDTLASAVDKPGFVRMVLDWEHRFFATGAGEGSSAWTRREFRSFLNEGLRAEAARVGVVVNEQQLTPSGLVKMDRAELAALLGDHSVDATREVLAHWKGADDRAAFLTYLDKQWEASGDALQQQLDAWDLNTRLPDTTIAVWLAQRIDRLIGHGDSVVLNTKRRFTDDYDNTALQPQHAYAVVGVERAGAAPTIPTAVLLADPYNGGQNLRIPLAELNQFVMFSSAGAGSLAAFGPVATSSGEIRSRTSASDLFGMSRSVRQQRASVDDAQFTPPPASSDTSPAVFQVGPPTVEQWGSLRVEFSEFIELSDDTAGLRQFADHDDIAGRLLALGEGATALVVDTYQGAADADGVGHPYLLRVENGAVVVIDPGAGNRHSFPPVIRPDLAATHAVLYSAHGVPVPGSGPTTAPGTAARAALAPSDSGPEHLGTTAGSPVGSASRSIETPQVPAAIDQPMPPDWFPVHSPIDPLCTALARTFNLHGSHDLRAVLADRLVGNYQYYRQVFVTEQLKASSAQESARRHAYDAMHLTDLAGMSLQESEFRQNYDNWFGQQVDGRLQWVIGNLRHFGTDFDARSELAGGLTKQELLALAGDQFWANVVLHHPEGSTIRSSADPWRPTLHLRQAQDGHYEIGMDADKSLWAGVHPIEPAASPVPGAIPPEQIPPPFDRVLASRQAPLLDGAVLARTYTGENRPLRSLTTLDLAESITIDRNRLEITTRTTNTPTHYMTPAEREQHRVFVGPDGRLYQARDGAPLHTSGSKFVMDEFGNLYSGTTSVVSFHSSFLGGRTVTAAGYLVVDDGRVQVLTDHSGHYRPTPQMNDYAVDLLRRRGLVLADSFQRKGFDFTSGTGLHGGVRERVGELERQTAETARLGRWLDARDWVLRSREQGAETGPLREWLQAERFRLTEQQRDLDKWKRLLSSGQVRPSHQLDLWAHPDPVDVNDRIVPPSFPPEIGYNDTAAFRLDRNQQLATWWNEHGHQWWNSLLFSDLSPEYQRRLIADFPLLRTSVAIPLAVRDALNRAYLDAELRTAAADPGSPRGHTMQGTLLMLAGAELDARIDAVRAGTAIGPVLFANFDPDGSSNPGFHVESMPLAREAQLRYLTGPSDDAGAPAASGERRANVLPPADLALTMPYTTAKVLGSDNGLLVSDTTRRLVYVDFADSLRVVRRLDHHEVEVLLPDGNTVDLSEILVAAAFREEEQADGSLVLRPNVTGVFAMNRAGNAVINPHGPAFPVRSTMDDGDTMKLYVHGAMESGWLDVETDRLDVRDRRATGPLYGDIGVPLPGDVRRSVQGADYLTANLIRLAAANPALLQDMIRSSKVGDVRLFEVRFFDPAQNSWVWVQVDDTFYVDAAEDTTYALQDPSQPLWPAVIEKAWAVFRGGEYPGIGSVGPAGQSELGTQLVIAPSADVGAQPTAADAPVQPSTMRHNTSGRRRARNLVGGFVSELGRVLRRRPATNSVVAQPTGWWRRHGVRTGEVLRHVGRSEPVGVGNPAVAEFRGPTPVSERSQSRSGRADDAVFRGGADEAAVAGALNSTVEGVSAPESGVWKSMPGDGNCLFHALAAVLRMEGADAHEDLRAAVVEGLNTRATDEWTEFFGDFMVGEPEELRHTEFERQLANLLGDSEFMDPAAESFLPFVVRELGLNVDIAYPGGVVKPLRHGPGLPVYTLLRATGDGDGHYHVAVDNNGAVLGISDVGRVDDDGVRRFDTNADGAAYASRYLAGMKDFQGPAWLKLRQAVHAYERETWTNLIVRNIAGVDARDAEIGSYIEQLKQAVRIVEVLKGEGHYELPTVAELEEDRARLVAEGATVDSSEHLKLVEEILSDASREVRLAELGQRDELFYSLLDYFGSTEDLLSKDVLAQVTLLDQAAGQPLRLHEPVQVVRIVGDINFMVGAQGLPLGNGDPRELIGTVQTEPGYMSTSVGAETIVSLADSYRLELTVRPGANGMYIGKYSVAPGGDQQELLLPRGTRYRITDVRVAANGQTILAAEVLPPQGVAVDNQEGTAQPYRGGGVSQSTARDRSGRSGPARQQRAADLPSVVAPGRAAGVPVEPVAGQQPGSGRRRTRDVVGDFAGRLSQTLRRRRPATNPTATLPAGWWRRRSGRTSEFVRDVGRNEAVLVANPSVAESHVPTPVSDRSQSRSEQVDEAPIRDDADAAAVAATLDPVVEGVSAPSGGLWKSMPGDGNCLFHALATVLHMEGADAHDDLRADVVTSLSARAEQDWAASFRDFMVGEQEDVRKRDFALQLANLLRDSEFMDPAAELFLPFVVRELGLNVNVVYPSGVTEGLRHGPGLPVYTLLRATGDGAGHYHVGVDNDGAVLGISDVGQVGADGVRRFDNNDDGAAYASRYLAGMQDFQGRKWFKLRLAVQAYEKQAVVNGIVRSIAGVDTRKGITEYVEPLMQAVDFVEVLKDGSEDSEFPSVSELEEARALLVAEGASADSNERLSHIDQILNSTSRDARLADLARQEAILYTLTDYFHTTKELVAENVLRQIALLDQATGRPLRLPEPIQVVRIVGDVTFMVGPQGLPLEDRDPTELIDTIQTEPGYMSTSVGAETVFSLAEGYLLELTVRPGANGLYIGRDGVAPGGDQQELLLPRGTRYRITGVRTNSTNSLTILTAEVLPPHDAATGTPEGTALSYRAGGITQSTRRGPSGRSGTSRQETTPGRTRTGNVVGDSVGRLGRALRRRRPATTPTVTQQSGWWRRHHRRTTDFLRRFGRNDAVHVGNPIVAESRVPTSVHEQSQSRSEPTPNQPVAEPVVAAVADESVAPVVESIVVPPADRPSASQPVLVGTGELVPPPSTIGAGLVVAPLPGTAQFHRLSEEVRASYRIVVGGDGLMYRALDGSLFDTTSGVRTGSADLDTHAHDQQTPAIRRAPMVLDVFGNIYAIAEAQQADPRITHASLLNGGRAAAAAEIEVRDGQLSVMVDRGGEYVTAAGLTEQALGYLLYRPNPIVLHRDFQLSVSNPDDAPEAVNSPSTVSAENEAPATPVTEEGPISLAAGGQSPTEPDAASDSDSQESDISVMLRGTGEQVPPPRTVEVALPPVLAQAGSNFLRLTADQREMYRMPARNVEELDLDSVLPNAQHDALPDHQIERRRLAVGPDRRLYRASDGSLFDTGNYRAILVMDRAGNLYAEREIDNPHQLVTHAALLGGGPATMAAEIEVRDGIISLLVDRGGEYPVTAQLNDVALGQLMADTGLRPAPDIRLLAFDAANDREVDRTALALGARLRLTAPEMSTAEGDQLTPHPGGFLMLEDNPAMRVRHDAQDWLWVDGANGAGWVPAGFLREHGYRWHRSTGRLYRSMQVDGRSEGGEQRDITVFEGDRIIIDADPVVAVDGTSRLRLHYGGDELLITEGVASRLGWTRRTVLPGELWGESGPQPRDLDHLPHSWLVQQLWHSVSNDPEGIRSGLHENEDGTIDVNVAEGRWVRMDRSTDLPWRPGSSQPIWPAIVLAARTVGLADDASRNVAHDPFDPPGELPQPDSNAAQQIETLSMGSVEDGPAVRRSAELLAPVGPGRASVGSVYSVVSARSRSGDGTSSDVVVSSPVVQQIETLSMGSVEDGPAVRRSAELLAPVGPGRASVGSVYSNPGEESHADAVSAPWEFDENGGSAAALWTDPALPQNATAASDAGPAPAAEPTPAAATLGERNDGAQGNSNGTQHSLPRGPAPLASFASKMRPDPLLPLPRRIELDQTGVRTDRGVLIRPNPAGALRFQDRPWNRYTDSGGTRYRIFGDNHAGWVWEQSLLDAGFRRGPAGENLFRAADLPGITGTVTVYDNELVDIDATAEQPDGHEGLLLLRLPGRAVWVQETAAAALRLFRPVLLGGPLWTDGPQADDLNGLSGPNVRQLRTLARDHPEFVRDMFRENEDGTVDVRLLVDERARWIRVNRSYSRSLVWPNDRPIWPLLVIMASEVAAAHTAVAAVERHDRQPPTEVNWTGRSRMVDGVQLFEVSIPYTQETLSWLSEYDLENMSRANDPQHRILILPRAPQLTLHAQVDQDRLLERGLPLYPNGRIPAGPLRLTEEDVAADEPVVEEPAGVRVTLAATAVLTDQDVSIHPFPDGSFRADPSVDGDESRTAPDESHRWLWIVGSNDQGWVDADLLEQRGFEQMPDSLEFRSTVTVPVAGTEATLYDGEMVEVEPSPDPDQILVRHSSGATVSLQRDLAAALGLRLPNRLGGPLWRPAGPSEIDLGGLRTMPVPAPPEAITQLRELVTRYPDIVAASVREAPEGDAVDVRLHQDGQPRWVRVRRVGDWPDNVPNNDAVWPYLILAAHQRQLRLPVVPPPHYTQGDEPANPPLRPVTAADSDPADPSHARLRGGAGESLSPVEVFAAEVRAEIGGVRAPGVDGVWESQPGMGNCLWEALARAVGVDPTDRNAHRDFRVGVVRKMLAEPDAYRGKFSDSDAFVRQLTELLEEGTWNSDAADLLLPSAAAALTLNLDVYHSDGGVTHLHFGPPEQQLNTFMLNRADGGAHYWVAVHTHGGGVVDIRNYRHMQSELNSWARNSTRGGMTVPGVPSVVTTDDEDALLFARDFVQSLPSEPVGPTLEAAAFRAAVLEAAGFQESSAVRQPGGERTTPPADPQLVMPAAGVELLKGELVVADAHRKLVPIPQRAVFQHVGWTMMGDSPIRKLAKSDGAVVEIPAAVAAAAFEYDKNRGGWIPKATGLFCVDDADQVVRLDGPTVAARVNSLAPEKVDLHFPGTGWLTVDAARIFDLDVEKVSGLLFNGRPRPEDVRQGRVGDCYLLSNLIGLAERHPDLIEDMIREGEEIRAGVAGPVRTFSVRFYDPEQDSWVWVTVDDSFYKNSTGGMLYAAQDDSWPLWPAVIEKAWAVWRGKELGYGGIDGGNPGISAGQLRPPQMPGFAGRVQPTRSLDLSVGHLFEADPDLLTELTEDATEESADGPGVSLSGFAQMVAGWAESTGFVSAGTMRFKLSAVASRVAMAVMVLGNSAPKDLPNLDRAQLVLAIDEIYERTVSYGEMAAAIQAIEDAETEVDFDDTVDFANFLEAQWRVPADRLIGYLTAWDGNAALADERTAMVLADYIESLLRRGDTVNLVTKSEQQAADSTYTELQSNHSYSVARVEHAGGPGGQPTAVVVRDPHGGPEVSVPLRHLNQFGRIGSSGPGTRFFHGVNEKAVAPTAESESDGDITDLDALSDLSGFDSDLAGFESDGEVAAARAEPGHSTHLPSAGPPPAPRATRPDVSPWDAAVVAAPPVPRATRSDVSQSPEVVVHGPPVARASRPDVSGVSMPVVDGVERGLGEGLLLPEGWEHFSDVFTEPDAGPAVGPDGRPLFAGTDIPVPQRKTAAERPFAGKPVKHGEDYESISVADREKLRIVVGPDGRLYSVDGAVFDTTWAAERGSGSTRDFEALQSDPHVPERRAMMVMDVYGNLYALTKEQQRGYGRSREFTHASLLGGAPAAAAAEIEVRAGVLRVLVDWGSGYDYEDGPADIALAELNSAALNYLHAQPIGLRIDADFEHLSYEEAANTPTPAAAPAPVVDEARARERMPAAAVRIPEGRTITFAAAGGVVSLAGGTTIAVRVDEADPVQVSVREPGDSGVWHRVERKLLTDAGVRVPTVKRVAGPLFGLDDMPRAADVKQGGAGTCYLLADLIGLADRHPEWVRQMIRSRSDGDLEVRFIEQDGNGRTISATGEVQFTEPARREVWVPVDRRFHAYDKQMAYAAHEDGQPLWPAVIEKAWALYRGGDKGYAGIEGGGSGATSSALWPADSPGAAGRILPIRAVDDGAFAHPMMMGPDALAQLAGGSYEVAHELLDLEHDWHDYQGKWLAYGTWDKAVVEWSKIAKLGLSASDARSTFVQWLVANDPRTAAGFPAFVEEKLGSERCQQLGPQLRLVYAEMARWESTAPLDDSALRQWVADRIVNLLQRGDTVVINTRTLPDGATRHADTGLLHTHAYLVSGVVFEEQTGRVTELRLIDSNARQSGDRSRDEVVVSLRHLNQFKFLSSAGPGTRFAYGLDRVALSQVLDTEGSPEQAPSDFHHADAHVIDTTSSSHMEGVDGTTLPEGWEIFRAQFTEPDTEPVAEQDGRPFFAGTDIRVPERNTTADRLFTGRPMEPGTEYEPISFADREKFRILLGPDGRLYSADGAVFDTTWAAERGSGSTFDFEALPSRPSAQERLAVMATDEYGNMYAVTKEQQRQYGRGRVFTHASLLGGAPAAAAVEIEVHAGVLRVMVDAGAECDYANEPSDMTDLNVAVLLHLSGQTAGLQTHDDFEYLSFQAFEELSFEEAAGESTPAPTPAAVDTAQARQRIPAAAVRIPEATPITFVAAGQTVTLAAGTMVAMRIDADDPARVSVRVPGGSDGTSVWHQVGRDVLADAGVLVPDMVHVSGPLFGLGDVPRASDVQQGGAGTCYLLADLIGLAERHPDWVRQMIRSRADGDFEVRFIEQDGDGRVTSATGEVEFTSPVRREVWVPVDRRFYAYDGQLAYAAHRDGQPLWPALIEKAWAIHRGGSEGYAGIEGGYAAETARSLWPVDSPGATGRILPIRAVDDRAFAHPMMLGPDALAELVGGRHEVAHELLGLDSAWHDYLESWAGHSTWGKALAEWDRIEGLGLSLSAASSMITQWLNAHDPRSATGFRTFLAETLGSERFRQLTPELAPVLAEMRRWESVAPLDDSVVTRWVADRIANLLERGDTVIMTTRPLPGGATAHAGSGLTARHSYFVSDVVVDEATGITTGLRLIDSNGDRFRDEVVVPLRHLNHFWTLASAGPGSRSAYGWDRVASTRGPYEPVSEGPAAQASSADSASAVDFFDPTAFGR
ncbi:C2 family cysteine protease [Nocardia sp. CS682]|uniref:C2 family cysteine protease n=1 Tax=Nocardia sp. CS682 TaxID=1047172 RepID=UPI00351A7496